MIKNSVQNTDLIKKDYKELFSKQILDNLTIKSKKNQFCVSNNHLKGLRVQVFTKKLKKISKCINFSEKSFFWTIGIIDKLISLYDIESGIFEAICMICLSLILKINEPPEKFLDCNQYCLLLNMTTPEYYLTLEVRVLTLMKFDLNIVTSYDFLEQFLDRSCTFLPIDSSKSKQTIKDFKKLTRELNFISTLTYDTYQFSHKTVACAIITIVREIMNLSEIWSDKLADISNFQFADFEQCRKFLILIFEDYIEVNDSEFETQDSYSNDYKKNTVISTTDFQ